MRKRTDVTKPRKLGNKGGNLNHFHFPSNSTIETINFYSKYFEFNKKAQLGKTHILKNPNGFLLAIDESDTKQTLNQKSHLGFQLNDAEKVRVLYLKMIEDGIPMVRELREPSQNAIHFYCTDPTGYVLEIGWYKI
jgi:predicted enzyme related to lactoylglutathione lyase